MKILGIGIDLGVPYLLEEEIGCEFPKSTGTYFEVSNNEDIDLLLQLNTGCYKGRD